MKKNEFDLLDEYQPLNERKGCFEISVFILTALAAILLVLCTGCSTTRKTTTDVDTTEVLCYVHDTTTITEQVTQLVRDTMVVTKTDTIRLTFVGGGGTYNTTTGEATGVASVAKGSNESKMQSKIDALQAEVAYWRGHSEASDSTRTTYHQDTEIETKPSFAWWLFPAGVAVGVALVVALKKLQITKPLMLWL